MLPNRGAFVLAIAAAAAVLFVLLAAPRAAAAAAAQMTVVDPDSWASSDHGSGAAWTGGGTVEEASTRRQLGRGGYISYDAMSSGRVPCSIRGASYYNCRPGAPANPYSRGCSAIGRCRG